jgi:hypothetical protein
VLAERFKVRNVILVGSENANQFSTDETLAFTCVIGGPKESACSLEVTQLSKNGCPAYGMPPAGGSHLRRNV